MQGNDHVNVRAFWGGRVEPIETQARMVWECWQRLAAHGDFLSLPWRSLNTEPEGETPINTFESLLADMSRARETEGSDYGFSQDLAAITQKTPCCATLGTTLSLSRLGASGLGNDAVLTIDQTDPQAVDVTVPVDWLLSMSVELVRDFVDIWRPDVVDINTTSLISQFPIRPGRPSIGFVTWLAPWVVDARKLPRTPIREEYRGGTLIGINPDAKDPVREATKLAKKIYDADILKPLPTVQPQWGDVSSC